VDRDGLNARAQSAGEGRTVALFQMAHYRASAATVFAAVPAGTNPEGINRSIA
jgi:hypothetical protein